MKLTKFCFYRARVFNLLPAVVITPLDYGFIFAAKLWFYHIGWRFESLPVYKQLNSPDVIEGQKMTLKEFWQKVYIAAIQSGKTCNEAKNIADRAMDDAFSVGNC